VSSAKFAGDREKKVSRVASKLALQQNAPPRTSEYTLGSTHPRVYAYYVNLYYVVCIGIGIYTTHNHHHHDRLITKFIVDTVVLQCLFVAENFNRARSHRLYTSSHVIYSQRRNIVETEERSRAVVNVKTEKCIIYTTGYHGINDITFNFIFPNKNSSNFNGISIFLSKFIQTVIIQKCLEELI